MSHDSVDRGVHSLKKTSSLFPFYTVIIFMFQAKPFVGDHTQINNLNKTNLLWNTHRHTSQSLQCDGLSRHQSKVITKARVPFHQQTRRPDGKDETRALGSRLLAVRTSSVELKLLYFYSSSNLPTMKLVASLYYRFCSCFKFNILPENIVQSVQKNKSTQLWEGRGGERLVRVSPLTRIPDHVTS